MFIITDDTVFSLSGEGPQMYLQTILEKRDDGHGMWRTSVHTVPTDNLSIAVGEPLRFGKGAESTTPVRKVSNRLPDLITGETKPRGT